MRQHLRTTLTLSTTLLLSACASILGGGTSQNVNLQTTPSDASFVVKSSSGIEMSSGTGNQSVRLPRKNEYQIEVRAPGYQSKNVAITKSLNGWVWGNLVVGWVIGFAIDFIGGAAYKLEPSLVSVSLDKPRGDDAAATAHIYLMDEKGRLIREITTELLPAAR